MNGSMGGVGRMGGYPVRRQRIVAIGIRWQFIGRTTGLTCPYA